MGLPALAIINDSPPAAFFTNAEAVFWLHEYYIAAFHLLN